jgi:secondary thiamine-phosphate synthase enzyme
MICRYVLGSLIEMSALGIHFDYVYGYFENGVLTKDSIWQAHIKSALIGASVNIPITNGRLATGTWQGIWYLEFRTSRHSRKVVATIQGQKA